MLVLGITKIFTWVLSLERSDTQIFADLLLQHVILSRVICWPLVLCQILCWEICQSEIKEARKTCKTIGVL